MSGSCVVSFPTIDSAVLRDARHHSARAAREAADWQLWLKMEGKAPRTTDDYERTVARLLRENPDVELAGFTDSHVMRLLNLYPRGSQRVKRAHLQSWFTWAMLTGRIDRNPLDRVPRIKSVGQKVIDVFSDAECALLEAPPLVDGVLFTLMLHGGFRKGECRHLQRKHVSLERLEVVVLNGKGGKDRLVAFHPDSNIARAISDLDLFERLNPDDFLWYSKPGGGDVVKRRDPVGEGTFHRWYERSVTAAGVPYRNPHTTRHTYATRWLRRGGRLETLSEQMGHASIATTSDLYSHLDQRDARADLAIIEAAGV